MPDFPTGPLVTRSQLIEQLQKLGVTDGTTLIVHCSLSSLGWVCGGAQTVIEALRQNVGDDGTVVMPTHCTQLTDPSGWLDPAVPESWWEPIREEMPAYNPSLTPTRGMGVVAESFRKADDARRSAHPTLSFAARGQHRDTVVDGHELALALGENSPLARLYDLDALILLLGVGHESNTSLHLAEYRRSGADDHRIECGAPMIVDGHRQWVTWTDIDHHSADYPVLGKAFERQFDIATGAVGDATARLIPQRQIVDFAVDWMENHR